MFDDTTFRLDNEQIRIMQHFFWTACADDHAEVCVYTINCTPLPLLWNMCAVCLSRHHHVDSMILAM